MNLTDPPSDEEAKVIAMGICIERWLRTGQLDRIPPGEFIPPLWMFDDETEGA